MLFISFSLDSRKAIGRGLVGGRSPHAPESLNLKGFARTLYPTVCGPMSVEARGGYRYVLTLTDDLSRYGYSLLNETQV